MRSLVCACLLLWSFLSQAQITFQFSPVTGGQTLQHLSLSRIMLSSTTTAKMVLTISVTEANGTPVVTVRTLPFYVSRGVNPIERDAFANGVFTFGTGFTGNTVRESGRFAEGEYQCCFTAEVTETHDPNILPSYQQCFSYQLQPLTPFVLTFPIDGDLLCNKRPSFSWQPPLPLPPDAKFRLILVQVNAGQTPVEGIANNTPIINQANITANTLMYPVSIPQLVEGNTYAWQVSIYTDLAIIKKSEIWTFRSQCQDSQTIPPASSYRELKAVDDGDYYIANKFLRFSFTNPYSQGHLIYTIECVSDPTKIVSGLPSLQTVTGINNYDMDLTANYSFKVDHEYLIRVFLPNNKQLTLRFIYKNE